MVLTCLITAIKVGREFANGKKESPAEPAAEPTPAPAAEPVADHDEPAPDVAFSTYHLSLEQKYLNLAADARGYYDEIVRYAMAVEDNKRYKNEKYEEYKVGKNRIVRIKIKNGTVVCELMIPNLDFKSYVDNSKVGVRQSATVIKVVDEASLNAVKGGIDVTLDQLQKERERKKEQNRIRNRERRAKLKSEQAAAEQEAAATIG